MTKGVLQTLVKKVAAMGASDLHLVAGMPPIVRIDGALQRLEDSAIPQARLLQLQKTLLSSEKLATFNEHGAVDFGLQLGSWRLRVNVHKQSGGLAFAMRIIASDIPSLDDLRAEDALREVVDMDAGFILATGPTGSGKSTLIASLIQQINQETPKHIVTLEDPIEFLFTSDQAVIEQRELGQDFSSFAQGLRQVLRQDPDVIFVGEMRDPETISLALTAAETGHLVLSTLHTASAAEAIERIVSVFEGSQQKQILTQLSSTLKLVTAQRLVRMRNGGRVAAREILVNTTAIQSAILKNNLSVIESTIQTGKRYGMKSQKQALDELLNEKLIDDIYA